MLSICIMQQAGYQGNILKEKGNKKKKKKYREKNDKLHTNIT